MQGGRACLGRQGTAGLGWSGDAPLLDARSLDDPLVRGVDQRLQVGVGGPGPGKRRAQSGHRHRKRGLGASGDQ